MNSNSPAPESNPISKLNAARNFALQDSAYYAQIVPGILPIIKSSAPLDQRRWGADFLAETFASPVLPDYQKQSLSLKVLDLLRQFFETPEEDAAVLRSAVQTATSIYPLVFRHTISNNADASTWQNIATIKSIILRQMDHYPPTVRVCCIKFIQKVVQVQTPAPPADPRQRSEDTDISLALVPRDHPLIPPTSLEPEASGLLDRLLNVFQDEGADALFVTATLNSVGMILRTRPGSSNRILNTVLNFNPFRNVSSPPNGKAKVDVRSMERSVRSFLVNLNKRNPNHPQTGRVQAYLDRLHQTRLDIFDESKKRPAPFDSSNIPGDAKRQRTDAKINVLPADSTPQFPPLPLGPVTVAQIFSLTEDEGIKSFDARQIPANLMVNLVTPLFQRINRKELDTALNAVRNRWLSIMQPKNLPGVPPADELQQEQDQSGPLNASPDSAMAVEEQVEPEVDMGPVKIPFPPSMSRSEADDFARNTANRLFSLINILDDPASGANNKELANAGFYRLAASNYDKDSWVTIVSRIATRPFTGLVDLDDSQVKVKSEGHDPKSEGLETPMSYYIRRNFFTHVVEDFRHRMDVALSWLNEEWYSERMAQINQGTDGHSAKKPATTYLKWCYKLLETLATYLDAKDERLFIRFLSEIPDIDAQVMDRVKHIADDPERVNMVIRALQYLIMYRPPVKNLCIDSLEYLWRNNDAAKPQTSKLLARFRPEVLRADSADVKSTGLGVKSPVDGGLGKSAAMAAAQ